MKKQINICIMLFLGLTASAQEFKKERMDSLFSLIAENDKAMGSLSVYKNGKETYARTIGSADLEEGRKAGPNTTYRVGSITKMFTAVLVMQLIEEEKLSLETKLSSFYPKIPNAEKITIEHLLRHKSGLFNITKAEDFDQWKTQEQTKESMLSKISSNGIVFEPGEKADYSNTNYILLSLIIEDLEKTKFSEVLSKKIIHPLQLKKTYFGRKIDPAKGEARAYRKTGKWTPVEETNLSVVLGAGALVSNPSDLNKFATALFGGKLVKPSTLEEMLKTEEEFGLGILKLPLAGRIFYGHTGGIDGFDSVVVYLPEENVSIAYTSNARDMSPHRILNAVVHIYLGLEYELPSFKILALSVEELKQFEGTYSAEGFPLVVKIFEENGQLMGQAEGQPSFPLEAYEKNKFKFDRFGLKLEFNPQEGIMFFKQGPNSHALKRA